MVYPLSNVLVEPLPDEDRRKLLKRVTAWATLWTFFSYSSPTCLTELL